MVSSKREPEKVVLYRVGVLDKKHFILVVVGGGGEGLDRGLINLGGTWGILFTAANLANQLVPLPVG